MKQTFVGCIQLIIGCVQIAVLLVKLAVQWLERWTIKLSIAEKPRIRGAGAKSFEDIPGPRRYPIIGSFYEYLPYFGQYTFSNLYENSVKRYQKYGSIVRENLAGVDLVNIYDPVDIETLFRFSGKYPERRSHQALKHFRLLRPQIYNNGGLIPTNGAEWKTIRGMFQNSISSPNIVVKYIQITNSILDEFVQRIRCGRANDHDFLDEISRLNLQLLGIITFDVKLECFSEESLREDSMCSRLIHAAGEANNLMLSLDATPPFLYTLYNPVYKRAHECLVYLEEVSLKFVHQKKEEYKDRSREEDSSILEKHLKDPNVDIKDIVGISLDMLLAGFDTTSFSMSFALYHLSTNPEVQQKLYEETLKLLPGRDDEITREILNEAVYLKAFVKESLRLNPISIGIGRSTTQDITLSGYKIKIGTVVVTNNQVSCRLPEYFDQPDRCLPERWLKDSEHYRAYHPFLTIPFGDGARQCIAKRLAEQNIYMTIMKLVRCFELSWTGKPLKMISKIINQPDGPLEIKFKTRL